MKFGDKEHLKFMRANEPKQPDNETKLAQWIIDRLSGQKVRLTVPPIQAACDLLYKIGDVVIAPSDLPMFMTGAGAMAGALLQLGILQCGAALKSENELLTACQAMLNSTDHYDDHRPLMEAVRAAVQKLEAE